MILSSIKQTNSLINVGDYITIKTESPIIPKKTLILGWYLTTNDIIDKENYISGEYAIILESENKNISDSELNWTYLNKGVQGFELSDFCQDCNNQEEPYYICFRFTKIKSTGQIINISKLSLKIQDNLESKKDYNTPTYDDSIFGEDDLYSECHIKWMYNVLDKLKTPGILPSFIRRDKDFSIFWGWLCHWYSIIVCYGRKFLNIFSNKVLFKEFLIQKDIYTNERNEDIYTMVDIFINEQELIYNFQNNKKLLEDKIENKENWITTDFIDTLGANIIKFKFDNISILDNEVYNDIFKKYANFSINISFLDYNQQFIGSDVINVEVGNANLEYFCKVPTNENMKFLIFSFPKTFYYNEQELPIFIKIFNLGKSYFSKLKDLTKFDLLNIFNDFRERGTNKTQTLIQNLIKVSISDSFYCNYINRNLIGWYLGKTSPNISFFDNKIDLVKSLIENIYNYNTGTFVEFKENFLNLSDDNSIYIKWNKNDIRKIFVFCALYTKNKVYEDNYDILNKKDDLHGIVIDNIPNNTNEINIPLRIVKSLKQIGVLNSTVTIDYNDILFCAETVSTEENTLGQIVDLKFLQIKGIYFIKDNLKTFEKDESDESIEQKQLSLSKNIIIVNKKNNLDTFQIIFVGGRGYIDSCNDTLLGVNFKNSILEGLNCSIKYEFQNNKLDIYIKAEEQVYNLSYTILKFDRERGYKNINLIYIDESQNELNLGFLFFRFKKYNLVLNDFNKLINLSNEEKLFQKEIGVYSQENLIVNYNLYGLPYSIGGFLNILYWFLIYYKNNSKYSDKEIENIISQKFISYNAFRLFEKSDDVINKKIQPLIFTRINIENPLKINDIKGNINLNWKGGKAPYTLNLINTNDIEDIDIDKNVILLNKDRDSEEFTISFKFSEKGQIYSNLNQTFYDLNNLNVGRYNIILKDSLGNSLIQKNIDILQVQPLRIKYKIYLSSDNSKDEVFISINGGYSPYLIKYESYQDKEILLEENIVEDKWIKLNNFRAIKNEESIIQISDLYNNSQTFKYFNSYKISEDKNSEGNCLLNLQN